MSSTKILKIVIPVVLVFMLLQTFGWLYREVVRPIRIYGQAMMPSFKDGAFYTTKVFKLGETQIARGTVITHVVPKQADLTFVKRVIGMPGETVRIQDGSVFIDNEKLDEIGYLQAGSTTTGGTFLKENESMQVPDGHFFVLGDYREKSSDSRMYGFIAEKDIVGVVWFCYWNCGE